MFQCPVKSRCRSPAGKIKGTGGAKESAEGAPEGDEGAESAVKLSGGCRQGFDVVLRVLAGFDVILRMLAWL